MNETVEQAQKLALEDFGVTLTVSKIVSSYVKDYVNDLSKAFQVELKRANRTLIYGAYSSELIAAASGLMKLVDAKSFARLKNK